MLFAENRPNIYFSFDTNYGITRHGSVGIVEDDIVSKATFFAPHSLLFIENYKITYKEGTQISE